mmetsp:Transcript_13146/g.26669  ORF Transcript_13146/g.26669 Transcript_13146/m.26669 type:complete len:213 (+) Transcript_13146:951-1589(+)
MLWSSIDDLDRVCHFPSSLIPATSKVVGYFVVIENHEVCRSLEKLPHTCIPVDRIRSSLEIESIIISSDRNRNLTTRTAKVISWVLNPSLCLFCIDTVPIGYGKMSILPKHGFANCYWRFPNAGPLYDFDIGRCPWSLECSKASNSASIAIRCKKAIKVRGFWLELRQNQTGDPITWIFPIVDSSSSISRYPQPLDRSVQILEYAYDCPYDN